MEHFHISCPTRVPIEIPYRVGKGDTAGNALGLLSYFFKFLRKYDLWPLFRRGRNHYYAYQHQ